MKAMICRRFGEPDVLELTELDDPRPEKGQVLLDVAACAVNFPDLLMVRDLYQFKPGLPFVPGQEVAGVVREVGPGVANVAVGQRVIASAQSGGLAERAVVPARSVIEVPDGLELSAAAGTLYSYGTSHHALVDRAAIKPGESLLVLGAAGGVGLGAVELGKLLGARVIAAASTDEKLALCREYGAEETVNYATEDLKTRVRELTDGVGADVVYDPVGGPYSEPAIRSTAWNGRFLVIGFADGEIPRIPLNLPLLRGCSIIGVFFGSFSQREPEWYRRNIAELTGWWRAGKLKPHVSGLYPLDRAADALRDLADRKVMGKAVVTVP